MPREFTPDRPTLTAAITKWMRGIPLSPTDQMAIEYAQIVTVARAIAVRP